MPPKKADKAKSSPKEAKKSSPKGKKNSPKKQSPKKKKKSPPTEGILVDNAVQTEHSTMCLLCNKTLQNTISVQSHLVSMDHSNYNETSFMKCRCCSIRLSVLQCEKHFCVINKANYMDQVLGSTTINLGPPTICLICKGRRFATKGDLISHLICVHSPRKKPNTCSMCEFTYEEPTIPEEEDELPEYNPEWDNHILKMHSFGISLIVKQNISNSSELRFPYACPLCGFMMDNNAAFQAHIICRHTTTYFYEIELFVCVLCDKPYGTNSALNDHIQYKHVKPFMAMGRRLMKYGRILNQLNYSHTCTICWSNFEYDFYLQAHILVYHTKIGTYTCGICRKDFSTYGSLRSIWKLFSRHEKSHMNDCHKLAIEFKITTDEVNEIPPDSDEEPTEVQTEDKKKGSPKQKKKTSPKQDKKKPSPDRKKDKKEKKKNSPPKKK